MERTIRSLAVVLAPICLIGLSACDDDPVAPNAPNASGLEFSFQGGSSGEYQSQGLPTVGDDGLPEFGSWAVARPDSLGGLVIAGFDPTGETTGNVFILQLVEARTGEFGPCGIFSGGGCHGRLFLDVDIEDLSSVGAHYEITDGSVTITELTIPEVAEGRVRGTFSATLTLQPDGGETIVVEDGVIDVPLSLDPFVGGGIACLARNLEAGTNNPCVQLAQSASRAAG